MIILHIQILFYGRLEEWSVLAYKKLKEEYLDEVEGLSITYQGQLVCIFYDTVHLAKTIRNNLLDNNRFLFSGFEFFWV